MTDRFSLRPLLGALILSAGVATVMRAASAPPDLTVTNEDATLRFTLLVDDDGFAYRVDHLDHGKPTPVLGRSPLGITRTDIDLNDGLAFVSATPASVPASCISSPAAR